MITKTDAYLEQCAAGMQAASVITQGKLGNTAVMVCDAVKVLDSIAEIWNELN